MFFFALSRHVNTYAFVARKYTSDFHRDWEYLHTLVIPLERVYKKVYQLSMSFQGYLIVVTLQRVGVQGQWTRELVYQAGPTRNLLLKWLLDRSILSLAC